MPSVEIQKLNNIKLEKFPKFPLTEEAKIQHNRNEYYLASNTHQQDTVDIKGGTSGSHQHIERIAVNGTEMGKEYQIEFEAFITN